MSEKPHEYTLECLGDILKFARMKAGLTQENASARLEISRNSICRIERGNRTPSLPVFVEMAKIYGMPLEDLLDLSKNPLTPEYATEIGPIQQRLTKKYFLSPLK